MGAHVWTATEAKAKFSEVLEQAQRHGPQRITKRGRTAGFVIGPDEFKRKVKPKGNLAEFFQKALKGSGIKIERLRGRVRDVDL